MDNMVLKTQKWLNKNYEGKLGYSIIPETGITGWTTIYALLHALQIELGITATANNFGDGTTSKFNERFPNGVQEQEYPSEYEDNIYGIIQGALWCKGYSTEASEITKHFYGGTAQGIIEMKAAAGCKDTSSTVTLNVMKALMSMTQFELVTNGNSSIRKAQQDMNYGYEAYIGLSPCDGLYSRDMNKSMIKVLQAIEGFSVSAATGNFGDGTRSKLPIIPSNGILPQNTEKEAIKLIKTALLCNGYTVNIDSTAWDIITISAIQAFQYNMCIDQTGICNEDTWMALLISTGNPDRSCVACDTRFEMTQKRIEYLKDNGYKIVGRYLTGGDYKELRYNEAELIIKNGLELFLIFQESGADLSYFTSTQGVLDAKKAVKSAREKNIPGTNVIYFAVDTDPTDDEIKQYIIPYFSAIANSIDINYYVGIYGTRNVCTQIMNLGYASSCFVSDLSTGFSGNMGFKMPSNWALDQFSEIKNIYVDGESENMDLDKDAYSGKLLTVTDSKGEEYDIKPVDELYPRMLDFLSNIELLENYYREYCIASDKLINTKNIVLGVLDFIRSFNYNVDYFKVVLGDSDDNFVNYIKSNYYSLYDNIYKYAKENRAIVDNYGGYIDLGHLACTMSGYLKKDELIFEPFWLGWAGDIAKLMSEVDNRYDRVTSHYDIAKHLLGTKSEFGYLDICSDADAIAMSNLISDELKKEKDNEVVQNLLSSIMKAYYSSNNSLNRMQYYIQDLKCSLNSTEISISTNQIISDGLLNYLILMYIGTIPSNQSKDACCDVFGEYIIENYNINL